MVTTLYAVTGLSSIGAALVALTLLAMVWSGLANYATLLGVPPGSTEAWGAARLRRRRRDRHRLRRLVAVVTPERLPAIGVGAGP